MPNLLNNSVGIVGTTGTSTLFISLRETQYALGQTPTTDTGYALVSTGTNRFAFVSSIGKVSFNNSVINAQNTNSDLTIQSTGTGVVNINGRIYINGTAIGDNSGTFVTLAVTGTNQSYSTTTGALTVAGGVGIGKDVYVGGNISATNLTLTSLAIALGGGARAATDSVAIGHLATALTTNGIAIGRQSVADIGVGIGYAASSTGSGVAIGYNAGVNGATNGIIINATGYQLNGPNGGLVIAPIRTDSSSSATSYVLFYNTATKELTYTAAYTFGSTNNSGISVVTSGTAISFTSTDTLQLVTNRGATTTNAIVISNTTSATSTTTGALVVAGGVGIGGRLYVGSSATFYVDPASGRVGIGTNSPFDPLTITNPNDGDAQASIYSLTTGTGTRATLNVRTIADGWWSMQTGNNVGSGLRFVDVGSGQLERMRIDATGTVYINTTTRYSGERFSVNGNVYINGVITSTNHVITSNAVSTSTNSGALVVAGGVGIGGDLNLGGGLYINNDIVTNKFIVSPYQQISPKGRINPGTGALSTITFSIAVGDGVNFGTCDPTGRFVYATANDSGGTVWMYAINQTTGALTTITTAVATGVWPFVVACEPNGRYAYVASNNSGTVTAYSINQSTGALTGIQTVIDTPGGGSWGVACEPTGRFVYVTNGGPYFTQPWTGTTVTAYAINQSTGLLSAIGSPIVSGAGAIGIYCEPSGRFAYVANASDNTISQFAINQTTGALSTITSAIAAGTGTAGIVCDPSGRFVYATDNTSILQFAINQRTGALTSIAAPLADATGPHQIACDLSGHFVYVSNQNNTISQYSINQSTGALSEIIPSLTVGTPGFGVGILVDVTGRFVYSINQSNNTISMFAVNNFSAGAGVFAGALQVVGGATVGGNLTVSGSETIANGIYSIGTFTGTYSDGIVVDYATGMGRISVGAADGLTFYQGGPASSSLMSISSSGTVTITTTTNSTSTTSGALIVKGGGGFTGNVWANTFYGNINASSITATTVNVTGNEVVTGNLIVTGTSASATLAPTGTGTVTINPGTIGTIDNMTIGATTPVTGKFTTLNVTSTLSSTSSFSNNALYVAGGIGGNSGFNINGNSYLTGNLTVNGSITATTVVFQGVISANSGTFYGDVTGAGALYAGVVGYVPIPQTIFQATGNYNGYMEINAQNINSGAKASTDITANADNVTVSSAYIDMGIASSTWDGSQLYSLGQTVGPNDGYLMVGQNATVGLGDLVFGTTTAGTQMRFVVAATATTVTNASVVLVLNTATTQATSTSTGALILTGGAGISGDVYVGGIVSATNLTLTGRVIALGSGARASTDAIAIGYSSSANPTGGGGGIAIGSGAAQPASGVSIGSAANSTGSGVAIGYNAGLNAATNGIVINATGYQLNGLNGGLVIAPIRADSSTNATSYSIYYNTSTKELTYTAAYTFTSTTSSGIGVVTSGTAISFTSTDTLQLVTNRGATTTNAIVISNTTTSVSTTTGALVVAGGVGIGGSLFVGGNITATTLTVNGQTTLGSTTATAFTATTAVINNTLSVTGQTKLSSTTATAFTATTLTVNGQTTLGSTVISGLTTVTNTTSATSTSTGALVVAGGIGIGGNAWIGGDLDVYGTIYMKGVGLDTISGSTGTFVNVAVTGTGTALSVNNNATVGGNLTATTINVTSNAVSTSTTTGALIVGGGVGISGNVTVGGNVQMVNTSGSVAAAMVFNTTQTSIDFIIF